MQRAHYAKKTTTGDASRLKIGIAVSGFNDDITGSMLAAALKTLREWQVPEKAITVMQVPGSFELPLASMKLIKKKVDVVIALGCIIKGETKHDEYIANAVAHGLTQLMLETGVPIGFGVITPNTLAQAKARSRGKANKGIEATIAALRMALVN
jgi:6,7-dimethyl-8-ribityllumazine synthase